MPPSPARIRPASLRGSHRTRRSNARRAGIGGCPGKRATRTPVWRLGLGARRCPANRTGIYAPSTGTSAKRRPTSLRMTPVPFLPFKRSSLGSFGRTPPRVGFGKRTPHLPSARTYSRLHASNAIPLTATPQSRDSQISPKIPGKRVMTGSK